MSKEDENDHKNVITKKNNNKDRVRYHCHVTGKYKDTTHIECNKIPRNLPIIFHNLEVYDGHSILRELNNSKDIDIQVIPETNETYMSIIVNNSIVFLDSLQICKASLDTLAGNLEDSDFKHLLSEFSKDKLEILKRKDAYPYEWVDSYRKFIYLRLPPKESFYSSIDDGEKRQRGRGIFLMSYIHVYKIYGKNLDLKLLEIFMIITLKKLYYY